ncbi:MAG: hypothetical protein J1E97_03015 [Muribaculaceae bacterium]|nr:hypothetical protein [Muribaculaceae bacterium]
MSIYEAVKNNGDSEEELKILELPVYIKEGDKMSTILSSKLMAYSSLIQKYASTLGFDGKQTSLLNQCVEQIISLVKKIEEAEFDNAYSGFISLFNLLGKVLINNKGQFKSILLVPEKELETNLFRARGGNLTDKPISEAYHAPLSKNYNCNTCRFSESGYPMLYLSQTEECLRYEFKDADEITIYMYEPKKYCNNDVKNDPDWQILDLAHPYSRQAYEIWTKAPKNDEVNVIKNSFIRHLFWPIIATCYCNYHLSPSSDELAQKERVYKVEYVFPQFLSRYLRSHHPYVSGIRYFTVRNKNLDSTSLYWTNYALFTDFSNSGDDDYDFKLLTKFYIKFHNHENLSKL